MTINGSSKLRDARVHRNTSRIRDLDRRNSLLTKDRDVLNYRIRVLKFQRYQFFVLGASVVYVVYILTSFFN